MHRLFSFKEHACSFLSLLFPRCCLGCGEPLSKETPYICAECYVSLPRTDYHLRRNNRIEQLLSGKLPAGRAASFFYYRKGSHARQILYLLKYRGQKEIGSLMGQRMTSELLPSGFFEGIDVVVPVPLHVRKLRLRGYNQSEWIARGVGSAAGIPVDASSVIRLEDTDTQTHRSLLARWENVDEIFELRYPERFVGKHVLLVDDVLTTGATMAACASSLRHVEGIRISVLTLAVTE